jgi:hypothetical protein
MLQKLAAIEGKNTHYHELKPEQKSGKENAYIMPMT